MRIKIEGAILSNTTAKYLVEVIKGEETIMVEDPSGRAYTKGNLVNVTIEYNFVTKEGVLKEVV